MRTNTRILSTSLALAVAVALTGCGADDTEPLGDPPTGQNSPGTSESPGSPGSGDVDGVTDAALTAIDLAEAEAGGVAYELDDEDDETGWKIDVSDNGTAFEVLVNWAGTEVVSSREDGSVDNDDVEKLNAVTLSMQEAITTASGEVSGHVVSVDLGDEDGVVVWEVEFREADTDREVYVDAQSGEILKVDE